MPTTLTDTRQIARLNPDALMERIAQSEIVIARANARYEARIKAMKDRYEEEVAGARAALAADQTLLASWIDANRDVFRRPRSRANAYGKYGLRRVSNLRIVDRDGLLLELEARGCDDCIKRVVEPIKPAVRKRLQEGQVFHGAELEVGERAFCEVSKALVEQALQEG